MPFSPRRWPRYAVVGVLALAAFTATAGLPWHPEPPVRRATGVVLAILILWITEALPLGITGLLIPVAATFTGVLKWSDALTAWGDPILFLFLGAFLLARALEKHGAFDFLVRVRWTNRFRGRHGAGLAILVMLVAGLTSTMQSNTAVAAMMLPVVVALARRVRNPALVLLGLSYGATFGGMATPIGTPPNFIGYAAMQKLDSSVSFISWLRVGLPVWLGTTAIAWAVLSLARLWSWRTSGITTEIVRPPMAATAEGVGPPRPTSVATNGIDAALVTAGANPPVSETPPGPTPNLPRAPELALTRRARRWAVAAFAFTVAIWLTTGGIVSFTQPGDPARAFVERYLPESLAPILAACLLFLVHLGPEREPVLNRQDFQTLDWDTLFLVAGGLCLGKLLQSSGAAAALATAVSGIDLPPLLAMFGLGGATVLLSELTSNTATAALMVPIAASLAPVVGLPPVKTIWLVALCASLGFALPVSTPPNAIIYGTRLVPLRVMAVLGIAVDILALVWVVLCMRYLT